MSIFNDWGKMGLSHSDQDKLPCVFLVTFLCSFHINPFNTMGVGPTPQSDFNPSILWKLITQVYWKENIILRKTDSRAQLISYKKFVTFLSLSYDHGYWECSLLNSTWNQYWSWASHCLTAKPQSEFPILLWSFKTFPRAFFSSKLSSILTC